MSERFLGKIYERRWNSGGASPAEVNRNRAWECLVKYKFQGMLGDACTVLDLGCGPGDFINRISAQKKLAVDLDSNNAKSLKSDIHFYNTSSENLVDIKEETVDVVFSSNLFEHLSSTDSLFDTLSEVKRVLRSSPNSCLIVMMPNARKIGMKFYDFIDHKLPLTETSLAEAIEISGFEIVEFAPGFFPYSAAKTGFKVPMFVFKLYLKIPIKNRPAAGQMLCVAKPAVI